MSICHYKQFVFFQVMPDWDEFVDNNSGRKYYYNTITKEKSWKPPRKTRGPMNEGKYFSL